MSAHYFNNNGMRGVIHLADIYQFKGYTFEWHRFCGPVLCRKDMEPAKRQPGVKSKFWRVIDEWQKLPTDKKEQTRIYG